MTDITGCQIERWSWGPYLDGRLHPFHCIIVAAMSNLLPRCFKPSPSKVAPPPDATSLSGDGGLTDEPKSFASPRALPTSDMPVCGNFSSENVTLGGGVAIFHLASSRVVLCYHNRDRYHFLPKGRKDMNEAPLRGAERVSWAKYGTNAASI